MMKVIQIHFWFWTIYVRFCGESWVSSFHLFRILAKTSPYLEISLDFRSTKPAYRVCFWGVYLSNCNRFKLMRNARQKDSSIPLNARYWIRIMYRAKDLKYIRNQSRGMIFQISHCLNFNFDITRKFGQHMSKINSPPDSSKWPFDSPNGSHLALEKIT